MLSAKFNPRHRCGVQLFMLAAILIAGGCSSESYLYDENPYAVVRDVHGNAIVTKTAPAPDVIAGSLEDGHVR